MDGILNNESFAQAYRRMAAVRLNPRRHTAANALLHSEQVSSMAGALARANGCGAEEIRLLTDLGRAHDIGKITGTAQPERSLEVLRACGVADPVLLGLTRWHDTALPWYRSRSKGQPPSERAWRRLASEVDLRLLAMFMVADRVDAPPGWRRNAPTVWFLEEARNRGLIAELALDLPDHPSEVSAGGAVVRDVGGGPEILVLRVRDEGYELPTGGIEWDELPEDAAVRETREEAAVEGPLLAGRELGHVDQPVGGAGAPHLERVRYFQLRSGGLLRLGATPSRIRERRWLRRDEVGSAPLVDEGLRSLLLDAVSKVSPD
jgi:ADP-ribose pyrophosphatase YjhB (NUDIX family)